MPVKYIPPAQTKVTKCKCKHMFVHKVRCSRPPNSKQGLFSTFIEFAIIKSLQFPVFTVCLAERGRDGDWETLDRGNSINCAFYENGFSLFLLA